jgi:hypothetical protein
MSNSTIPPTLQEIWDSKQRAEDATRGMSREELIQYYRDRADEAECRLGIKLKRRAAANPESPAATTT